MMRFIVYSLRLTALILLIGLLAIPVGAGTRLICASTTSLQNSGFFDYILPLFEKETGIEVHVVAVGTGAALEIGKRGDADLVFVHAKSLELEALRQGYFIERHDVMYNDFVIIGPDEDPAGIKDAETANEAFMKIYKSGAPFVSRGDGSGTHGKELALWREAGLDPGGKKWYMQVGQGMSRTQRVANQKRAYTITDRGTWLFRKDELDLALLLEGDPALHNQYGVMAVNPERHGHVKHKEAAAFTDWLASDRGQRLIASYKISGNTLFRPNAGQ